MAATLLSVTSGENPAGSADTAVVMGERLFVSVANPDRPWARWIGQQLARAGYEVEYDEWSWPAGVSFIGRMDQALRQADRVIAVLSPAYLGEESYGREEREAAMRLAHTRDGVLVPVLVAPCGDLPPLLGRLSHISLLDLEEDEARAVLLGRLTDPAIPIQDMPFPGFRVTSSGGQQAMAEPDVKFPGPAPPQPPPGPRRSGSWKRRWVLISLAIALVTVLVFMIKLLSDDGVVTLEGKMASKADFFKDQEVQELLKKHHFRVHITQTGSREIAIHDIDSFDFVFPSGQPAADLIARERGAQGKYINQHRPFVSPIVLATYREYAETLQDAGIVTLQRSSSQENSLYYTIDMGKFLKLTEAGRLWNDIGIGKHGVTNGNKVLAQTADICEANSAGTYLGLIGFVENNNDVPETEQEADKLAEKIKPLLVGQGLPGTEIFPPYVAPEGKGIAPIVVVYEHQYLAYQIQHKAQSGELDRGRVLLYPATQFVTQPAFIALTPDGDRLGRLISTDPDLQRRATELGFRVLDDPAGGIESGRLSRFLQGKGIPVPDTEANHTRATMPSLALLERMIAIVGDCPPAEWSQGRPG